IAGGSLVLLLFLIGIFVTATSEHSMIEERLGKYIEEEAQAAKEKGERSTPVGDWVETKIEKYHWGASIARELARADLKLRTGEYLALMFIVGVGVGALAWYLGGQSVIFGLIGVIIGARLPRMYVKRLQGQRLMRFNDQLADMLNLMVNGLRAGYSTMQAMEAVAKEMPAPICDEFRRVVQEMQLGLPMDRALDNLLRRIPSDDLDLVIAAINVQREVGGNLAEILDTISHTIRERVRIKGEIRVLTAQVVYSGRFLAMMPLFISLALWVLNRPYMMQFFNPETRTIGLIMLTVGAIMIIAGYFVMMRIADIEV
ncbi:MAG: type II secretion system F family protein, partial [Anaerolineaceae bacterium]